MIQTIGERIAACRRAKEMTQDQLAEKLNVSPQAVSKWENNISCPDISLLPELSNVLGVTTDQLLKGEEVPAVQLIPSEQRKPFEKLLLRVRVNSADGDIVKVNLPMSLVKVALETGMQMPQVTGKVSLEEIDLKQVLSMVEQGLIGKLVEVQSADGDTVEITVE